MDVARLTSSIGDPQHVAIHLETEVSIRTAIGALRVTAPVLTPSDFLLTPEHATSPVSFTHRVAGTNHIDVVSSSTSQLVNARTTEENVIPAPAKQRVVAAVSDENVPRFDLLTAPHMRGIDTEVMIRLHGTPAR